MLNLEMPKDAGNLDNEHVIHINKYQQHSEIKEQ